MRRLLHFLALFPLTFLSQAVPLRASSAASPAPPGPPAMILLPGGEFTMGDDRHLAEEAPAHRVRVDGFWLDRSEVTNAQFAEFVAATGYRTFAETPLDPVDFPDAPPEALAAGALVFRPPPAHLDPRRASEWQWWSFVPGADWRHPEGPASSIEDRMDHPVVCVSYEDAEAYCRWAGKRLPTAAEWEFAARGGLDGAEYAWGEEFNPDGKWLANTFQGDFPAANTEEDGFAATAPVGSFPANAYGFVDLIGNVWELTADWFLADEYRRLPAGKVLANPRGPAEADSVDPRLGPVPQRTTKGGSFLCAPSYCNRYRPAARHHADRLSPTNHTGFRCARDGDGSEPGAETEPASAGAARPS